MGNNQRVLVTLVLLSLVAWTGPVGGQISDEDGGEDLREEVQETLGALEEAGLSISESELNTWALGDTQPMAKPGPHLLSWTAGRIRSRWSAKSYQSSVGQAKLDLSNSWFRIRGRLDWGVEEAELAAGAVQFRRGRTKLSLGALGIKIGSGLLTSVPGRNGSLAADSGFSHTRENVSLWSGATDDKTLYGGSLEWGFSQWSMRSVLGKQAMGGQLGSQVQGIAVSRQSANYSWGSGFLSLAEQFGISIWAEKHGGWLQWQAEGARWYRPLSGQPDQAIEAVVRLKPGRRWALELGCAQATGGRGLPMGARSAYLRADEGRGWALRSWWRSSTGVKFSALWAQAQSRKVGTGGLRLGYSNLDLTANWKMNLETRMQVRFRTTDGQQWAWSERFPWAVPELDKEEQQQLLQGAVTWQRNGLQLRMNLKHLLRVKDQTAGNRTLYRVSGKRYWGKIRLRGSYGSAWGDPVTLVDAVCPLPGLVQPRHWGYWHSEFQIGAGIRVWGIDVWLAGVQRRSDLVDSESHVRQFWAEIQRKW